MELIIKNLQAENRALNQRLKEANVRRIQVSVQEND
jgi:hypothetical protein